MKTVFVVEPDRTLARSYKQLLENGEVQVHAFTTAQQAIKALDVAMPNVVVLEVALPTHNGLEFLYELRSYSDTSDVKIVVNSLLDEARLGIGYVTNAQLGIVEYVSKTSPLSVLKGAVHANL